MILANVNGVSVDFQKRRPVMNTAIVTKGFNYFYPVVLKILEDPTVRRELGKVLPQIAIATGEVLKTTMSNKYRMEFECSKFKFKFEPA